MIDIKKLTFGGAFFMSKYSSELKLQAVVCILNEGCTLSCFAVPLSVINILDSLFYIL